MPFEQPEQHYYFSQVERCSTSGPYCMCYDLPNGWRDDQSICCTFVTPVLKTLLQAFLLLSAYSSAHPDMYTYAAGSY